MNRQRLAAWSGAVLGAVFALVFAVSAQASDWPGKVTEEFHHTYPLTANGRIQLENVNGDVHITAWDKNEVQVDAVKYANSQERLNEVKIEVDASSDFVEIKTHYRDHDLTFNWGGRNNPASVAYTLMVPRNARLDEIQLVNSALDIHGVAGEVRASCVNGHITAQGLQGRTELSGVNGKMEVQFDRLSSSTIDLSSVNGPLELTLPSDAKADIEASTVSGGIEDDFGLQVIHHHWVGHDLHGQLGGGGTRVKLSNVNGRISIRHANDGKSLSSSKNTADRDSDDDDDDEI
jgi:hypothetical protein